MLINVSQKKFFLEGVLSQRKKLVTIFLFNMFGSYFVRISYKIWSLNHNKHISHIQFTEIVFFLFTLK